MRKTSKKTTQKWQNPTQTSNDFGQIMLNIYILTMC
jgi:hypothetical protein